METATILIGSTELKFGRDPKGKIHLLSKINLGSSRYDSNESYIPRPQYLAALRRAAKKLSMQKKKPSLPVLPATKQLSLF